MSYSPILQFSTAIIHCVLGQIRLDRVSLGNPLGVEYHIGGRHSHGAQVSLGTVITLVRGIPSGKLIGIQLNIGGILRHKIIAAQRRLKLNAAALVVYKCIVVVEFQVVAVAGVAEVVVFFHSGSGTSLLHFIKSRVRPPLSEAGNVVELFCIRQPAGLLNIDFLV